MRILCLGAGALGGYFGGRTDSVVNWLCATVAAMPGLLFILAVAMDQWIRKVKS